MSFIQYRARVSASKLSSTRLVGRRHTSGTSWRSRGQKTGMEPRRRSAVNSSRGQVGTASKQADAGCSRDERARFRFALGALQTQIERNIMDPIVKLVDYARRTRYEDLPEVVVDVVKKAIVDTVGAGIAGTSSELGKIVVQMAQESGGKAQSSIYVHGDKVPVQEAAFVNATMARCRELDDVHEGTKRLGQGMGGHVSTMVVPAVMAVAESLGRPVSGKELIVAITVGSDIIVRMRTAAGVAGKAGFMAETVGPFGVAASVARLLGLSEEATLNAMGAAYSHCAGTSLSNVDGGWDGWLPAGQAARAGVIAAELARRGYIGTKVPLLGWAGLYPLYYKNEFHESVLLSDLGKEFEVANVSIKPYCSCKATHHAIHTALELMRKHDIKANQIERIEVRTCDYNMRTVVLNERGEHKHSPRNLNEAQFSLPFTMATAIVKGRVFIDVVHDEAIKDPEILHISRMITARATPEKNAIMKGEGFPPDDVDIWTKDGKCYTGCELHVKGHPQNPMTFEEVVEKFNRCVEFSIQPFSRGKLDAFVSDVHGMDRDDDVRGLMARLNCQ